ncbi:MAG TPA: peptide chain release factor aRF-1 [archaeon]|nr:peptide chain release factor aRF-1 [archaeon]HPV66161.1 peptide chain release factor aRF-1 [archaeon]
MDESQILLLKKKLKEIKTYKGDGTQLISLYIPPNADRSSVTKQLTDEISQSSNIKSQQTRKNVQAALRRLTNYLRQIDFKLPETGLVLFSGNVSENPAKNDVVLLTITPPKPLTTKLYWCDSEFHTAPLEDMALTDEVYGLVTIDKREATVAILTGKSYRIILHETSGVPGKTRAGGQSSVRFERLREKAAQDFYRRVGERMNVSMVDIPKLKGIIVGGPGMTKHEFLEESELDYRLKNMILGTLDTSYTDESGIKEMLDKSGEILKDASIIKERQLVNKFIEKVATNGLATYGYNEVIESIMQGKAEVVIVSEGLEWSVYKYQCTSCNQFTPKVIRDKNKQITSPVLCQYCESSTNEEEVEIADLYEYLVEISHNYGTKVVLVSIETPEGNQFLNTFGGLGAFLRYK